MPVPPEQGRISKAKVVSTPKAETKRSPLQEKKVHTPAEKSKHKSPELQDPQLDNISPVVMESAQDALASIESLFGDANTGPTQEQIQKETDITSALSTVVDMQKPSWADTTIGDFAPSYNFESTRFDDPQPAEETQDILSRRLKAAFELISTIDAQGKPDNPHEAMLEGDGGIPFDTALGVQEAQGTNRVEGITVSEAIANHHYDEKLQGVITSLQSEAGELDREKTARTLAAYGQEVMTAEQFRDKMTAIRSDIAGVDPLALSEAHVATNNGEFVVYDKDGQVITTLDKSKATALVADAMISRITSGEQVSAEEQRVLALSDKITKTGFGLTSWRDEMTVSDQVIGRDDKGKSGLFSKLDITVTEEGTNVLVVKKGNKCLLVEEGQKTVLRDNFSPIVPNELAKCPVMPEKQPQDTLRPNSAAFGEKPLIPRIPLQPIGFDRQIFATRGLKQAEMQGQKDGKRIDAESVVRQVPIVEIGFSLREAFNKAELLGIFLNAFKKRQEGRQVLPLLLRENGGVLRDAGEGSIADLGRQSQKEKSRLPHDTPAPPDGRPPQNLGSTQEVVQNDPVNVSEKSSGRTTESSTASNKVTQEMISTVQKITKASRGGEESSGNSAIKTKKEMARQAGERTSGQTVGKQDQQTQHGQNEGLRSSNETRNVTQQHREEEMSVSTKERSAEDSPVSTQSAIQKKEANHVQDASESHFLGAVDVGEKHAAAIYEEMVELLGTVGDSGTVIASSVVDGKNEKQESVVESGETSLGTNERNVRLDPAMMMSALTKQSVAQSIIQPMIHFSPNRQSIQDNPHIQTALRLEKSWAFDHDFPTAEPIAARDFVGSVLSEMMTGI